MEIVTAKCYRRQVGGTLTQANAQERKTRRGTGRVAIWLDDAGKAAVCSADGSVKPAVQKLVQAGTVVLGADLFLQGDEAGKQTRVVANPREFAGYTLATVRDPGKSFLVVNTVPCRRAAW